MKKAISIALSVLLVLSSLSFVAIAEDADVEKQMLEALGNAPSDSKLDFVIDAPEEYFAGEEITITVTAKNVKAENGIHVAAFKLYYDASKLLLTNDLDEEDENKVLCTAKLPNGWENFTKVTNDYNDENPEGTEVRPLNDGVIDVNVFTAKSTSSAAVRKDDQIVFEFTFIANGDAEGDIGIVIPHTTAECAYNGKDGEIVYEASGDYAVIEREYTVEEKMLKKLGKASDDSKLDFVIEAPDGYIAGQELSVKVSVKSIASENGIHVAAFNFYYDNEKLLLTNDLDEGDENALQCIHALPSGWENFSTVSNDFNDENPEGTEVKPLNDGVINVNVFTTKATASAAVKEDDRIVFEFTFKVAEDAEEELGFVIPHAETEGAYNGKNGEVTYNANGSYAILSKREPVIVEAEEGVIEEDAELNVEPVENEAIEEVFPIIESIPSAIVFDIFIEKDDERIQPNGEIKISILAPIASINVSLRVYHISDDGKITDMNAVFENGYYSFTTTHLSYYMLADPNEMYTLGDVNSNGDIEKYDYIAVKRAVMGTLTLSDIQQRAADINRKDGVEKYDYILVKRHVLGTYKIGA